ncbi:MAG: ABC transporter permease [Clostridia bacterium]|jgi:ABC-2 type transport system permease protein|nr:ABC transporter permease [Clostridia bacterium]
MRDILTVMKFTIKDMVKRKSFIISTLIILVLIVVGFNVPNVIKSIKGDNTGDKFLIVDNKNVFEGTLENLKQMDLGYEFEITNSDLKFEDIKRKIEDEEINGAIIINPGNEKIKISYIVENTTMMDQVPEECVNSLTSLYSNLQISKLGLTEEQLQSITPNFDFSLEQTEEKSASGNVFVMMIMSIVLFYAIYFCAYQVSSSITTEKTSKIMETLVTSTSPRTIILGKTIGIGLVGLAQMIVIVATALISAKAFLEPELLENALDMSNITPYLGIMTAIYFILGYLAYALLYALTGSTVSKPEDIQSANTPVALLAVIGFYLSYFTMMNPTSDLNLFASLFPISSPFCMPFRIMMGLASIRDVALSIAILIVTIVVISHIAIKIYSNAILNYGTKMTFKDIIKVYKDKQN